MASISKREESERKVVKITIDMPEEDKAEIARLKLGAFMTMYVHDDGTIVLEFEENRR